MRLVLAVMVASGCGNHVTPPRPDPIAPVRDPAVDPTRVGDEPTRVGSGPGPTDEECDALIAHAIDLRTPGDAGIGSADRATLTGEVRDRVLKRCRAMPRATYRCAIAATTTAAFTGCD